MRARCRSGRRKKRLYFVLAQRGKRDDYLGSLGTPNPDAVLEALQTLAKRS